MRRISRAGKSRASSQRGFSYLFVVVMVAVMAITATAAMSLNSVIMQRDRERELLFRGMAYRDAIGAYYKANGLYPRSLDELISDPHYINRHYLRQLYVDPFGGQPFKVLYSADGGVMGVASTSAQKPLQQADFPFGMDAFIGASTYSDWTFIYSPSVAVPLKK